MNIEQALEAMRELGFKPQHQTTGQGWSRAFIHWPQESGIPLSLGRVMFKDGELQHIKWYCTGEADGFHSFKAMQLRIRLFDGATLSQEKWDSIVVNAKAMCAADLKAKQDNRASLPKFSQSGRKIKRGRITGMSLESAIGKLIDIERSLYA